MPSLRTPTVQQGYIISPPWFSRVGSPTVQARERSVERSAEAWRRSVEAFQASTLDRKENS